MKTKSWFEVDKEGLKVLQAGKPKHYVLRELVQNAWDEDITLCNVKLKFENGVCFMSVEDNNPEGFKNIKDSFTLFGDTHKRKLVNKRGRFNLGEKQAIALCDYAIIRTTKGSVIFNENGREETEEKLEKGSIIELQLKMTEKEFLEMAFMIDYYLPPKGIKFVVNDINYPYKKSFKTTQVQLPTEIEENSIMRRTKRITGVDIHKAEGKSFLYELGIPVMEIDCEFSVDVGQKIPMGVDRETVQPSYLKDIFSVVLNETVDYLNEGNCSASWVRIGSTDEITNQDTIKKLIKIRYGDKVVVANPLDPISNDDALAEGYRVIHGRELSGSEWSKIKEFATNLIPSSTSIFGRSNTATDVKEVKPDKNMIAVGELAKKIAKKLLGIKIAVRFYSSKQVAQTADYGNGVLSFNVGMLDNGFFKKPLSTETLDLIFHELGHHAGHHTEKDYHELITRMAGESVMLALKDPDFFKETD